MALVKKYYNIILVFVVLALNLNLDIANAATNASLRASFIFGDSLVDAGNNNYLSTLSKADTPPNGIDFKASGGNPTGRYTNGRTIADIVGNFSFHFFLIILYVFIYI